MSLDPLALPPPAPQAVTKMVIANPQRVLINLIRRFFLYVTIELETSLKFQQQYNLPKKFQIGPKSAII